MTVVTVYSSLDSIKDSETLDSVTLLNQVKTVSKQCIFRQWNFVKAGLDSVQTVCNFGQWNFVKPGLDSVEKYNFNM